MHHMDLGDFSINFNGDFSGDILVDLTNGKGFIGTKRVCEMPFMVMAAIVSEKIRREKIAALEKMSTEELLGYPNDA
jgi:hypothetical protein